MLESAAPRSFAPIVAALFLAELTCAFETSMIYAAMPKMVAAFGSSVAISWLITIYLLVSAGAAAVAGRLGDMYGRRQVLVWLLAMATLGSVISASTEHYGLILLGRGLQGLGAAAMPLTVGIIYERLPSDRVAFGIGLIVSAASAGTAAGLVVGGILVDAIGWHSIFYAAVILGLVSVIALKLSVPPSPRANVTGPVDVLGGLMFLPALTFLLLGLTQGSSWGWGSPLTLGLFVGAAVIGTTWVRRSLRHPNPLIEVRLFKNRIILIANVIVSLVALGALQITLVFSMLMQAPTWTGIGLGLSATVAGLVKLPSNIFSLVAGPISGWLAWHFNDRTPMIAGCAITAAGWLLILPFHGGPLVVGVVLCVISFGTTMIYAAIPNAVANAAPPGRTSEATGMVTVVRQTFMAAGALLISALLSTKTIEMPGNIARFPAPGAFMMTGAIVVLLSVAAAFTAFLLPAKVEKVTRPR